MRNNLISYNSPKGKFFEGGQKQVFNLSCFKASKNIVLRAMSSISIIYV